MIPANALKAVDNLLRGITQVDRPFGGKFMFLGGDFRQVSWLLLEQVESKLYNNVLVILTCGVISINFI